MPALPADWAAKNFAQKVIWLECQSSPRMSYREAGQWLSRRSAEVRRARALKNREVRRG